MTKLIFFVDDNCYVGFKCSGHSGYAEQGSDIVCAAVSTAVQMCAGYLMTYHSDRVTYYQDNNCATIELQCKTRFAEADMQISVLNSFAEDLAQQYPEYFTFEILEV